ncbi:tetratricopeptide repeat protein [Solwaraspora sp. WMMA2080]|uniref:tetratricopeptide repeat protein n=1 Tax=unclassified Solwaraspora TaxID=2627926 RepID=UPI00248B327E|nr:MULTISPECIES: tetratricopeptide repeat protein [unclassified Solwaraspora]WBB97371.1 tetratricopeptide repeat protein [Solwaraspora sp. WMMA2059]WBC18726.1 tetratricopeptide repeat protein [Solwaraspora sp. WMMA2080]
MSSESSPEPPTDVDGYLQRAGLLADLGRYDEAAGEIGFAVALEPDSVAARIMLARVHLAADRPEQALAAIDAWADEPPNPWSAEATATAAPAETATAMPADAGTGARSGPPDRVALLVVRGLALIDLRRYADAARLATDLLATYPDDAYAQRSGAAILAGSRNGQPALNAAWRGVELAPQDAQAHLVLGLVGARLELFDLAHRAYGEALRLDPLIGEAQHDVGVIHLEQRRYAAELAVLAERATAMAPPPPPQPSPARPSRWAPQSPGSAPMDPRLERPPTPEEELRRLVLIGAGYSMIAAVTVACLAGSAASRGWAVVAALGGFVLVWVLARRVPGRITEVVSQLADRRLATAVYAVGAAPVLIFCYAAIATPWLLVSAIVAAAVAQFMVLRSATARPPDQR